MSISTLTTCCAPRASSPSRSGCFLFLPMPCCLTTARLNSAPASGPARGGALAPLMSVDKASEDLVTFDALVEESRQYGQDWAIVYVASLSLRDGRAPASKDPDQSLQRMIESIRTGMLGSFIPFDRKVEPVLLS